MQSQGAAVLKMREPTAGRPVPQLESINPAKAKEYLATMVSNRTLISNRVIELALEMEAKRWVINGETIKFDDKGNLIDGQHRLQACILSEMPFITYVVRGLNDDRAFATIDVGRNRTHGDILSIAGVGDPNRVAGAGTILFYYKNGRLKALPGPELMDRGHARRMLKRADAMIHKKFSRTGRSGTIQIPKEELLAFLQPMMPKLLTSISLMDKLKMSKVMTNTTALALHAIFSEIDPVDANSFMRDLGSGENLSKSDPVYVLREKLLDVRHKSDKGFRLSRWAVVLLCFKAWNDRRAGAKVKYYRVMENEKFPRLR